MWILAKHPPPQDGAGNQQYYLLGGRKYVVGRKDCDIVITGDCSISRKHATISVGNVDPGDPEQAAENVTVVDTSKTGVNVNSTKVPPNGETTLKNGDLLSFGGKLIKYKLIYHPLVIVTSCINTASAKATVKSCMHKLGGFTSQHWSDKATHLVMDKVTFTIKVVCALACGKPVVTVKYLENLLDTCDKKTGRDLPDEKAYLPSISEESLLQHELLFHPNLNRKSLMCGKLFVLLVPQQLKRIKEAIAYCGGDTLLKNSRDVKFIRNIVSSQTIFLQVEKKDEKGLSTQEMSWIKEVYANLKKHNLRPVRESEIGLAVLNVSLERYCNPTLNTAPALAGTTHTQILADSMCATQQTQVDTQPIQHVATVSSDGSVKFTERNPAAKPLTRKESGDQEVPCAAKVSGKQESENQQKKATQMLPPTGIGADKGSNTNNTALKRKRPATASTESGNDEENIIEDMFKKPKLREAVNNNDGKTEKQKLREAVNKDDEKTEKQSKKNIIHIDDDEDEDDVFSFDFSKPCASKTGKSKKSFDENSIVITSTIKEDSETIPIPLDINTEQIDVPPSEQQPDPGSNVLFTPSSKKAAPDTYQPSLITPLEKTIPDTFFPSAVTPVSKTRVPDTPFTKDRVLDTPSAKKRTVQTPVGKHIVPDSCPLFKERSKGSDNDFRPSSFDCTRKSYNDDDDDDDDPFSFNISACPKKQIYTNNKNEKKKSGSSTDNEGDKYGPKLCETSNKVSTESDMYNISYDERQNSRYLKALSSSQEESENIYQSDEGGGLVLQENKLENKEEDNEQVKKHKDDVDMSYLLDDEDDYQDGDLVSKEYSVQNPKRHIRLDGFISALDARPQRDIIKEEEDSDLVGVERDLVQTTFVSLVVNDKQVKKPRKTADVPGSKLRNFKTFKKQYYAGRSRRAQTIGKNDMAAFESENLERASLFADIRGKDEEEAAENRRIDKMFDVIPHRKR